MNCSLKILIVNTTDSGGGAARAAHRLYQALEQADVEVAMLVQKKNSNDYKILAPSSKWDKLWALLRPTIDQLPTKWYKNRTQTLFSPAWISNGKVLKLIKAYDPDIVHLHWINGGMLKIEDLAKIDKPLVWSLHDMWAFTGGCHYDEECTEYTQRCGSCKVLGSTKTNDLSHKIYKRKEKNYSKIPDLTIVGLSQWLMACSQNSTLLKTRKHINLPNPIDTNTYKPFLKKEARDLWNLPQDKKLILFGAMNATGDKRKGFKELSKALHLIKDDEVELVIFGSSKPQDAPEFGFQTHYVGQLNDDVSLVTLYSAVDVMVVPSLQENLSNAIMESLSCGTPVVAFGIGGNGDMIDHEKNGYLAKLFDAQDMAKGIEWILDLDEERYNELCQNAREKVIKEFDNKVVVQKYIELYREILDEK